MRFPGLISLIVFIRDYFGKSLFISSSADEAVKAGAFQLLFSQPRKFANICCSLFVTQFIGYSLIGYL